MRMALAGWLFTPYITPTSSSHSCKLLRNAVQEAEGTPPTSVTIWQYIYNKYQVTPNKTQRPKERQKWHWEFLKT